jgi:hypothetical protein
MKFWNIYLVVLLVFAFFVGFSSQKRRSGGKRGGGKKTSVDKKRWDFEKLQISTDF